MVVSGIMYRTGRGRNRETADETEDERRESQGAVRNEEKEKMERAPLSISRRRLLPPIGWLSIPSSNARHYSTENFKRETGGSKSFSIHPVLFH